MRNVGIRRFLKSETVCALAFLRSLLIFVPRIISIDAGINITDIFVPRVRLVGQDAELECSYTRTNRERVYSVKWWRDNDQFYQYIPRNNPPLMPFNVSGISVDASSSDKRIILRHVTAETSGIFACEVMAEQSFETVRRSGNMTVIDLPDGDVQGTTGPIIKIDGVQRGRPPLLEYEIGQTFDALCIASKTFPKSRLVWSLNGLPVPREFISELRTEQDSRYTYTSKVWITFTVTENLFDEAGNMQLTCNCSLGDLWHSHDSLLVRVPIGRSALNFGLFSGGEMLKGSSRGMVLISVIWTLINLYLLLGCNIKYQSKKDLEYHSRIDTSDKMIRNINHRLVIHS